MQINETFMEDFYNNKENENGNIRNDVFNINPKLKYTKVTKITPYNNYNNFHDNINERNDENTDLKRKHSLKFRTSNTDTKFRERRAKSISFADISEFSNSNNNYLKNNNCINRNYSLNNINNQKKYNTITRNRSNSNLNGTTVLAKKKSFRKPKVLLSSKEHIRRIKKMKSSSAISYKNVLKEDKKAKRRYSIHSPPSPKSYLFDDDFYGDRFDESYSDLPPNSLYHELKQAHEKELLQREIENKNKLEILDEETVYYDSDNTLHNFNTREIDVEENNSLLKFLLKYLENSINKVNSNSMSNSIENDIQESISGSIIKREIEEEYYVDSFRSESSHILEEDSELHKQEELLESMFNDVVKIFNGCQTKFYYIIIKLISFLLYNGGKMELGSQILKYILRDKLGISISCSDESSLSSTDINNINHLENEEMEFITLHDIKENKKHQKRRKNGYRTLNKFWMIIHSIFIFLFLYIYLMRYNILNEPPYVTNIRNINNKYNLYNESKLNGTNEDKLWASVSPTIWFTSYNEQYYISQQCFIDEFTKNNYFKNFEKTNKSKENNVVLENNNKFINVIENITPWMSLVILECTLFSAQFGFQYLIMDEVVPFFKPASYTSILFINQIINFFIQYKLVWKMIYNDFCLYLFIFGIYFTLF